MANAVEINTAKVNIITKSKLELVRNKLTQALEGVDIEGLNIEIGSCRYSDHSATLKLELSTLSDSGEIFTKERTSLNEVSEMIGIKYGDEFISSGESYKVTGYKPRSRKYPIVAMNQQTQIEYVFTLSDVQKNIKNYQSKK
ncbi:hypothetical protein UA32_11855 [Photobacterium angustum]|uniref:Uncharacterized protein n=1 Tax=Photobacterium angustum TaxID=661 RepID=A0ABX5H1W2_PHOAN|nr:hypothetical protein [Photobacterium angustum]KJG37654.1 hypothetical protein UA32_11855 [Photobacterium angustum]PSX07111.1 hypothetical protein C0W27_16200 [Photobacterium angustum]